MDVSFLPQDSLAATSIEAVERYNASMRDLLLADPAAFWAAARTAPVQRSLDTFQRFARYEVLAAVCRPVASALRSAARSAALVTNPVHLTPSPAPPPAQ